MKTLAPELSALMTIFRSTGPVISTRRSSRSRGTGETVQFASRTSRVSARNFGAFALIETSLTRLPRGQQARDAGAEAALQIGDELNGFGRKHALVVQAGSARSK